MDDQTQIDPWANMGNRVPSTNPEVTKEGLERAAAWEQAMTDAPAFAGNNFGQPTTPETPNDTNLETENHDENIADASAILNYGLNAAAREKGVDAVVNTIKNFVYKGQGDPIIQLLTELGIDTPKEFSELRDESRAIKSDENTFRNESVNAPATLNKSVQGALNAIQDFKLLITEVESSPEYNNLRSEALKNGKSIYGEAVSDYNVHDLTTLFNALSAQKENQIENQSSTTNPSPETDATESEESLPQ